MKLSATEEYIKSTHKKYADKCGSRLGTSIKGVFTDQPHRGHMLHEDTLSAQTIMNGSLMRCYELMDYPGVDILGSENNHYNIVKQLSSVANQCGKQWLLSELYGCTGWQMTLEDYKRIGDWQALMGINLRCPHLSWYTMEGECKRDYPASIFYQSAWFIWRTALPDSTYLWRRENRNAMCL